MKKIFFLSALTLLTFYKINAQENIERNPITTAAPFLNIVTDARSGGMGDIGVATSADINSQHHNPAKFTFLENQFAVGVNYTPWLRNLTNDVFVSSVSFANRLNESSAWGANLKYFSLGQIDLTDVGGQALGSENPNELSLDVSYSLKLNPVYSMGVAVRYIRSDYALNVENSNINTVNSYAVDLAGYYQSEEFSMGNLNGKLRGGFNLSNIGPRVTLTDGGQQNFIPTNMKLGGGFEFILDDYNTITTNLEFTKLLVPTPSIPIEDADGNVIRYRQEDVGFLSGMFKSFGDAPGGGSEELKEFTWAFGAEYMYDKTFAFRTGYFNESQFKGERKYFTLGAGFKFNSINIDLSYLLNASKVNNPLENTLRFSLALNFGDNYEGI